MRRMTTTIMTTCAALVLGATLASAQAPDTDRTTIVTFSAPVALPGVTLPAGSYLFKLADSQVNRNIVQVFDKDRSKIFATILAVPAQRNETTDETVITFREAPANAAPAIRYWYYPGERSGQEFAYPRKQAVEIANAAHTSVLSIDTDDISADAMKNGQVSRVEPGAEANQSMAQSAQPSTPQPSAQPAQPEPAPAQAAPQSTPEQAAPAPKPMPSAPAASSTEGAVGTSGSMAKRSGLPKTASTLPLVGLAGLLALGSALRVRALRRAHA